MIASSPLSLPIHPTLENITGVLNSPNVNIFRMYLNSILITVFGASVCILVSSLAAYYLARVKSRLSGMLYVYFLFGLMVPYVIVYVPLVTMYSKLGLVGNLPSLILIFVSGSISFSVFMYHGFIGGISIELEEAAIIDGAGDGVIFWKIVMPLVKPCTTTVAIFIGLSMWNDFLTPLLIGQVKTITVGIYTAIGPYASDWGSVFAYVMFATLPPEAVWKNAREDKSTDQISAMIIGYEPDVTGLDMLCERLTQAGERAADAGPASEQELPIIFNEYCTTWGDPSHENITGILDAIRGKGFDLPGKVSGNFI